MFRFLFGLISTVIVICVIGTYALQMFPGLQPLWDTAKTWAMTLYNESVAKNGVGATVIVIICVAILIGTSNAGKSGRV